MPIKRMCVIAVDLSCVVGYAVDYSSPSHQGHDCEQRYFLVLCELKAPNAKQICAFKAPNAKHIDLEIPITKNAKECGRVPPKA